MVYLEISENSLVNTYARVFIKKETLVRVFTCEYYEIPKGHFRVTASEIPYYSPRNNIYLGTEYSYHLRVINKGKKSIS